LAASQVDKKKSKTSESSPGASKKKTNEVAPIGPKK
jgi:hypothetical protein